MRILITGGAGFIGSNLAAYFAPERHEITLFDNLSRAGTEENLRSALSQHAHGIRFVRGDVRSPEQVSAVVPESDVVFHLAGQVAVTTSVSNPRLDLEVNTMGTFNVLEAARKVSPMPAVFMASTNKVYGAMEGVAVTREGRRYAFRDYPLGVDERQPLDFHSPYGCSKGAADQYARDYHRIYGLPTVVFRMSCIYGPRQFGTVDQGWVAHFITSALHRKQLTIYGDGRQVRDLLYVDDLARLFHAAIDRLPAATGNVYNVGGGSSNSMSLLELVDFLEERLGYPVPFIRKDRRPGDQPIYVSNTARASNDLGWAPTVAKEEGLQRLLSWLRENRVGSQQAGMATGE